MIADVLIVADQADLNVYKTANQDDVKDGAKVGCCGPGSGEKSSCGSSGDGAGWDVDFNEWAGKYLFLDHCGASEAYIHIRFVQDIRYQARRWECFCRLDDNIKFVRIF